jgi:hypothetical protein
MAVSGSDVYAGFEDHFAIYWKIQRLFLLPVTLILPYSPPLPWREMRYM